jgi:hypothetical protein
MIQISRSAKIQPRQADRDRAVQSISRPARDPVRDQGAKESIRLCPFGSEIRQLGAACVGPQAEEAADGSGAISSRSKPQVSEEEGDDENAGLQRPFNRAEATTRLLSIFQCEPFVSLCPFGPRVVLL